MLYLGKPLGCYSNIGSQRIAVRSLEGNQVAVRGNIPTVLSKGNRFFWQQEAGTGEIQPDFMAQGLRFRLPSRLFLFLFIIIILHI